MSPSEARQVLADAEVLCSAADVSAAVDRVAAEMTHRLANENPLLLVVMNGAVFFSGQLLPRLAFPLEQDYLHATRYNNTTSGGQLEWLAQPDPKRLAGRVVVVIDDVLDEGITLAAIKAHLVEQGVAACYSAVLVEKDLGRKKPVAADFVGLHLPNRYLFGAGMDVRGYWRNLPALYAIRE